MKIGKASVKSTQELMTEVQEKITQITAVKQEQSAYLSSDDLADLEKMEALLQGSLSLLEQFEKTGGLTSPTAGFEDGSGLIPNSINLNTGFNGAFETAKDPSGTYDSIIQPVNQGTDLKNALIFKMDDGMESVKTKNVGDDVEMIVTYRDGPPKSYLIQGLAKSPVAFVIAADQTTKGVIVDCSQLMLKTKPVILGGSGDDTLIGSQGQSEIYGNAGADTIYGMGSMNKLDGGEGKDTIYGGVGKDTITGGGGFDKVIKGSEENIVTDPEDVSTAGTVSFDAANFKGTGWSAAPANGELVISKDAGAEGDGSISLTIPDGTMTYGKEDGDDLVLMLTPLYSDGTPGETAVVRIKDFLKTNSHAALTITSESSPGNPNMMDLGSIHSGFNAVKILKGEGGDVVVLPQTAMDDLHIDVSDLGKATLDANSTKKIKDEMVEELKEDPEIKPWTKKVETGSGTITLYPNKDQEELDLPSPAGYYLGVAQDDPDGKGVTLTLFIKSEDGSKTERLVIHVKKTNGNPQTITIDGQDIPSATGGVTVE